MVADHPRGHATPLAQDTGTDPVIVDITRILEDRRQAHAALQLVADMTADVDAAEVPDWEDYRRRGRAEGLDGTVADAITNLIVAMEAQWQLHGDPSTRFESFREASSFHEAVSIAQANVDEAQGQLRDALLAATTGIAA